MPRSVFYQYQQSGEYLVSENSRCTSGTFYLTKWQLLKWYVSLVYLVGWQIILHFSTFTAILKNVKLLVCFFHDRRVSLLKILSCTLSFVKYNKKHVTEKCLTAVKRRIQLVASQIRRIFYAKHNVCFSLSGKLFSSALCIAGKKQNRVLSKWKTDLLTLPIHNSLWPSIN